MIFKSFVIIFVLCFAQGCLSKPATAEGDITEGRGFLSTLWYWVTYPFSSSTPELKKPPVQEPFIASTSKSQTPESIKIFTHNVTVWCNNQTCTTQKCDEFGCSNITCNIYDTDLMGECRVYNIITTSEEPVPNLAEPSLKPPQDEVAEVTSTIEVTTTTVARPQSSTQKVDPTTTTVKPPLQLEGFLSATVGREKKPDLKEEPIMEYQEI